MKNKLISNSKLYFTSVLLFAIISFGQAQGFDFPLPGEDGNTGTGVDAPIGTFVYLALAIGGFFGYKKLKAKN